MVRILIDRVEGVETRSHFDLLSRQINVRLFRFLVEGFYPADIDQGWFAREPIHGIDNRLLEAPVTVIQNEIFHVAKRIVLGMNVVAHDFMSGPQMFTRDLPHAKLVSLTFRFAFRTVFRANR